MEYIISAAIILVANVCSGNYGSRRWEYISAIFGWVGTIAFILWFIFLIIGFINSSMVWIAREFLFPVAGFCIFTFLGRDYEKIIKPCVDRWWKSHDRKK